jgi:hypothetical protein
VTEHEVPQLVRDGPSSFGPITPILWEHDRGSLGARDHLRLRAVHLGLDQLDAELPREVIDPQVLGRLHAKLL